MTAMDIIGQRFRAVETSILEAGGCCVPCHLQVVPETRVSSVTPGLRAMMAAEERQSHQVRQHLWKRPRDPHWKPWIEHPNSSRSQGDVNQPGSADDLSSAVDPNRVEGEEKDQRQTKKQRQHSKEVRPPKVSNDKGPRRGLLGDLTDIILPDDGATIGK